MWTDDVRDRAYRRRLNADRPEAPRGHPPPSGHPVITLGIETSCDETAVAIVEDGFTVRTNLIARQEHLHERFGGVVPEVAARAHVEALNPLLAQALEETGLDYGDLDGVAVTVGPGARRRAAGRDGGGEGDRARHPGAAWSGSTTSRPHYWANFLDARAAGAAVRRAGRQRRPHDARPHARAVPPRGARPDARRRGGRGVRQGRADARARVPRRAGARRGGADRRPGRDPVPARDGAIRATSTSR